MWAPTKVSVLLLGSWINLKTTCVTMSLECSVSFPSLNSAAIEIVAHVLKAELLLRAAPTPVNAMMLESSSAFPFGLQEKHPVCIACVCSKCIEDELLIRQLWKAFLLSYFPAPPFSPMTAVGCGFCCREYVARSQELTEEIGVRYICNLTN